MKFLKFWFPVVLYSGIIFFVSSLPSLKSPLEIEYFDKIVHILEYIPFGFLLTRAFLNTNSSLSQKILLCCVILASFLYGLSDEYHQSFVEGRNATVMDVLADTIGGMLGAYVYFYFLGKLQGKKA